MDKLKLSEKVLVARVNSGLYEYLAKYAKDKDTTISEITRQSLELFYYVMPYKQGDNTIQDKEIFNMILEIHEDLDTLNLDMQSSTNRELIEEIGELQLVVKQAIAEHKEIEKDLSKRIEALEKINSMIEEEFKQALSKLKKRVLNHFENETQLEGSAPSSLVWSGAPQRAQGKVSIEV